MLNKDFSSVVLFTSNEKIVEKFHKNVNYDQSKNQHVMLINEKKVMNLAQNRQKRGDEFVGVYNEQERPTTMASRKMY